MTHVVGLVAEEARLAMQPMYALVRDAADPNRLVFGELLPVGDGLRYFRKFPSLDDIVEHLNLTFAISTPAGICKGQAVRVGFLNYSAFSRR